MVGSSEVGPGRLSEEALSKSMDPESPRSSGAVLICGRIRPIHRSNKLCDHLDGAVMGLKPPPVPNRVTPVPVAGHAARVVSE
jgi:hypothetical protein